MLKNIFSLLVAAVAVFCVTGQYDGDGLSNIPSHLLECYQNPILYDRQNRLPMTMAYLIELISTIEQHPENQMDIQDLALSLIHMFRVDGIEEDTSVQASDVTIPFKLTGFQFNKYRILIKNLIPRSSHPFPNASLTPIQKCSLHFMLSNSVEKKLRGDEATVCNVISGNLRGKRDVANSPNSPPIATKLSETSNDSSSTVTKVTYIQTDDNINNTKSSPDVMNLTAEALVPDSSQNVQHQDDVEMVDQTVLNSSVTKEQGKKGDMMLNSDGDYSFNARQTVLKNPQPESSCPVENGVVYTKWGSVSAGTVLAGIATGLAQQTVSIKQIRLRENFRNIEDLMIDSRWAATLAGDLSEVAVRQIPKKEAVIVGVPGNWNNTQVPRWYFIGKSEKIEMTDAEIRGGIDGLILATYVKEWNEKANRRLRLSNLLERYYSTRGVFDPQYQACKRKDLFPKVAPTNTMTEQTTAFSYILHSESPDVVVIRDEGIKSYSTTAVNSLNSAVPSNVASPSCSTIPRYSAPGDINAVDVTNVEPHVDLLVVIDCNWNFEDIQKVLVPLREGLKVTVRESNITVYSGQDFQFLMNSTNMALNSSDYYNCNRGMNLKILLETNLKAYYRDYLEREKNISHADTYATLVLFIPSNTFSPSSNDIRAAQSAIKDYRLAFPDVRFLYLAPGNADTYQELVEDKAKDVFTYADSKNVDVSQLVSRLQLAHRRISNPACGADSPSVSSKSLQLREVVAFQGTNYYRVHPKYMFGAGDVNIKIRPDNGKLKVCNSRKYSLPGNNGTSGDDSECKTISGADEFAINLSGPCSGYEHILQCQPLYISIQNTDETPSFTCTSDKSPECRNIDDVPFTVTHTGFTCGGGCRLASPLAVMLGVVLMSVLRSFSYSR